MQVLESLSKNVPASHWVQVEAPADEKLPLGQVVMLEAVQEDPSGQRMQAAPWTGLTLPSGQAVQAELLLALVPVYCVPGGQPTLETKLPL